MLFKSRLTLSLPLPLRSHFPDLGVLPTPLLGVGSLSPHLAVGGHSARRARGTSIPPAPVTCCWSWVLSECAQPPLEVFSTPLNVASLRILGPQWYQMVNVNEDFLVFFPETEEANNYYNLVTDIFAVKWFSVFLLKKNGIRIHWSKIQICMMYHSDMRHKIW